MKKLAILSMICLLLTACSAAASASSGNGAEVRSEAESMTNVQENTSSDESEHDLSWREDFDYPFFVTRYPRVIDDGTYIYMIGADKLARMDSSGNITVMQDYFFARSLALSDDDVYYINCWDLYMMPKMGGTPIKIEVPSDYSIYCVWIHQDQIHIGGINNQTRVVDRFYADLTDASNRFLWKKGLGDFTFRKEDTVGYYMDLYFGEDETHEKYMAEIQAMSDRYIYYTKAGRNGIYRKDRVTRAEELVPICDRYWNLLTVVNGWIYYYEEKDNGMYRITEDLSRTEQLLKYDGFPGAPSYPAP